jgi:DNA-directed RNA polymerase subunit RPC12/RpoP
MANEMRDRLRGLLLECGVNINTTSIADHLIENGVVVRKQAKWIYSTDCYRCSVCAGKRFNLLLGTDAEYCPYCGAKMIFEKEGADNG